MKTISHMVRRYMAAAFSIVTLIITVNVLIFISIIFYFGTKQNTSDFRIGQIADSFTINNNGELSPGEEYIAEGLLNDCAWSMLLDAQGNVIWSYELPTNLNHSYSIPEVAAFSRWYLDDYPVYVYRNDYGLLVTGMPKDSLTRFNFYIRNDILNTFLSGFFPLLLFDVLLILIACLILGWRASHPLLEIGKGIDSLANGTPVNLTPQGISAELAQKLNQTSLILQKQKELIEQRDIARTNWIAGVSHDIRTPLSLVLGYAEQLKSVATLTPEQQAKASIICTQSQKIKSLIEDLNLTSKLQYNAQPLRLETVQISTLLRQSIADFCNNELSEKYVLQFSMDDAVESIIMQADKYLIVRAFENILNNSMNHNPDGCTITVKASIHQNQFLELLFADNGSGFPVKILNILQKNKQETDSDAPHILGLSLVIQIFEAHGGKIQFENSQGAVVKIFYPLTAL